MKAALQLKPHSVVPGASVVEVIWNGRLVCTIAGADGPGIRIISKYVNLDAQIAVEPAAPGDPGVIEIRLNLPPVG